MPNNNGVQISVDGATLQPSEQIVQEAIGISVSAIPSGPTVAVSSQQNYAIVEITGLANPSRPTAVAVSLPQNNAIETATASSQTVEGFWPNATNAIQQVPLVAAASSSSVIPIQNVSETFNMRTVAAGADHFITSGSSGQNLVELALYGITLEPSKPSGVAVSPSGQFVAVNVGSPVYATEWGLGVNGAVTETSYAGIQVKLPNGSVVITSYHPPITSPPSLPSSNNPQSPYDR